MFQGGADSGWDSLECWQKNVVVVLVLLAIWYLVDAEGQRNAYDRLRDKVSAVLSAGNSAVDAGKSTAAAGSSVASGASSLASAAQ